MNVDSLIWFGISGGTAWFAATLLWQRYVRRTSYSVQSRGSFLLFAILALVFALGALAAGFLTLD